MSSEEEKNVLIEATNSCEFYKPASSSINIASTDIDSLIIPDLTLQSLFKFTVKMDKEVYHYGEYATATLSVKYRGDDEIEFISSGLYLTSVELSSGDIYTSEDIGCLGYGEFFSKDQNIKTYNRRLSISTNFTYKNKGYFKTYLGIDGQRDIPGYYCAPQYKLSHAIEFLSDGARYFVSD